MKLAGRLAGKVAIVTGGASGFGAGIARKFVNEGARVVLADINEPLAHECCEELGTNARFTKADVSVNADVKALVEKTIADFGKIDIMINNAGVTHLPNNMEEISEEDFDRVLLVNTKSIFLTSRHLVPVMRVQKGGVILNVASTAGVSPRPRLTWYNATKGWVITATKSMAVELASQGIRVNALNPVAGETPLLKSFLGEDTPEMRQKFLSTIPIGRFATPEDMGNAACYLCSDEASMITGVCMEVDGGRCI